MALDIATRYGSSAEASSADYPEGSFKNDTTPGDQTGTPLDKDYFNDIYGFLQALLANADVAASGTPDTALVSQYFDALRVVPAAVRAGAAGAARIYLLDTLTEPAPGNELSDLLTISTSTTVGPAGSGATVDGSGWGFDQIPAGATMALIRMEATGRVDTPAASTSYILSGWAYRSGASSNIPYVQSRFEYTTNGVADQMAIQKTVREINWVKLDSSRRLTANWSRTGTFTSSEVSMRVLGYAL